MNKQIIILAIIVNVILTNVISEKDLEEMKAINLPAETAEKIDTLNIESMITKQLNKHFARGRREVHTAGQTEKPHKRTHDIVDSVGLFLCVSASNIQHINVFDLNLNDYNCLNKHFPIIWTTGSPGSLVTVNGFLPTGKEPNCMPTKNVKIERETCLPYTK